MIKHVWKLAILENGHRVQMSAGAPHLKVGDSVSTQWGPRKVVRVVTEVIHEDWSEPHGC